ncbi:extensin-like domain-containing protein [Roseivivax sediminis]|uniref:extensin-like domain-containing protein n=1 Tax=Roseivivax sediminis TaxID=936889 RepID=UPI0037442463
MLALPVHAGAPDTSPRPVARTPTDAEGSASALIGVVRPEDVESDTPDFRRETDQAGAVTGGHVPGSITARLSDANRPATRPASIVEAGIAAKIITHWERPAGDGEMPVAGRLAFAGASQQAVAVTLRPVRRSQALVHEAMARQRERRRGAICGDPAIQGEAVGYVPGRIPACGIDDAVRVRAVSGVALSQQALVDCGTARALKRWVDRGLKPAVGRAGGGVAELRVAAHYICRTRNHQPGAKVSEHGKGRAIDISAIRLRDGTNMTVLGGWRSANQGPILKRAYRAACGIFGTTLGPDSDRFHQDHFHFDTARYRSGSYCR